MAKHSLTLLCLPSVEEKLLDLLLEAVGDDEVFISAPTFSHGLSHSRLSNEEQVMGRSASAQFQVILTEAEMSALLQRLRGELRGTGLRYWATALTAEGEIE
jgi:hypothetical protein